MSSSRNSAYARLAEPHEYGEVAWVLTRAYARDPAINWYGCVDEMLPVHQDIKDYNALPAKAQSTLNNLHTFQVALIRATILSGGLVTVAVIPNRHEEGDQSTPSGEVIAGASLWLKPGQTLDFPLMTVIRSGIWKILWGWGLTGVRRLTKELSPAVEQSLAKSFKAHGMDRLDSWYLLETVVDPPHEGKGMFSLMIKDGFERAHPKPVHLEATTRKSRDIYAHFGFEIDEEHQFGRGAVDVNGIAAKGEAATGYPEWIMTKWNYA